VGTGDSEPMAHSLSRRRLTSAPKPAVHMNRLTTTARSLS